MCVDEGVFAARTRDVCNETEMGLATERRKEKRNGASNTIHRMGSPRLICPCPNRQRIVSSRISSSRQYREAATKEQLSRTGACGKVCRGVGLTLLLFYSFTKSADEGGRTIRR